MKKMVQFFKSKRLYRYSFIAAAILVSAAVVYAATVPYTFTSGTVASSSEVNANFSYLADRSWEKSGSNLYYSSGNVGIGTSTPSAKLEVYGSNNAANLIIDSPAIGAIGDYSNIEFRQSGSVQGKIGIVSEGNWPFGLRFFTSAGQNIPTEKVRITSNGNVGIGTTNPDRNLVVAGSTAGQIKIDSATGYDSVLFLSENNSVKWAIYNDASNNNNLTFERGGGERLVTIARTSGNVGIGTTSPSYPLHMASGAYVTTGGVWTNASSRTYKEHIAELTSNEAIMAFQGLKPVTYNYKADKDEKHVGFIAEDVPAILATKDRKGVSPMDVVALLTKVVQEQQKTIAVLAKEVEGLKKGRM